MNDTNTSIRSLLRPAIASAVLFMLLTGLAYPLVTTAAANLLLPWRAQGSLVQHDGRVIGSALLGQAFTAPRYFHPRPSVTQAADPKDPSKTVDAPYNAELSAASNDGSTNRKLIDAVAGRARAYRSENGLAANAPVPVDAVTASGSGLDPEISLANAELQLPRVAAQRGLPQAEVERLLNEHTAARVFGLFGVPRVNVLELNLALDTLAREGQHGTKS
ncbi:potassium-transporting ATPase subunit KdpC [Rhodanobacter sp. DHB23]|uniref:potassium-transporting ATPase subunit KdpC n=1 Tax=Rhodanobacter sp. DHB23 TaxID=2775923 RepID=UPI00177D5952|nr:potassium-transporting ATPase subunit KdpC [Rhodanobacter sp. DHB23]MBD8871471.1 potassium-transporting ATPase subunit KdpC [Rhodanobacter sp. DHB23]